MNPTVVCERCARDMGPMDGPYARAAARERDLLFVSGLPDEARLATTPLCRGCIADLKLLAARNIIKDVALTSLEVVEAAMASYRARNYEAPRPDTKLHIVLLDEHGLRRGVEASGTVPEWAVTLTTNGSVYEQTMAYKDVQTLIIKARAVDVRAVPANYGESTESEEEPQALRPADGGM